ncbi:MAG: M23 family metallopeptidase [Nitrospinae bacterium]|nr:M23 family metallopeptidase [Nitrospinota bacterium]
MYPPLKNRDWSSKPRSSSRTLFNLFFVLSVGFNIYFLVFQDGSGSVDNVYATGLEEAEGVKVEAVVLQETTGSVVAVHEKEAVRTSQSDGERNFEIQQASFNPSSHFPGRNIKVLRFKVRNSLNYSVCRNMAKDECGPLAAHLARLLAWSFDVSRNIRNGDRLEVLYERLDSRDRFKILKLNYQSGYLGKTLEANFYKGSEMKHGGYFDRKGKEIAQRIADKQSPIADYIEITSLPGDFRKGRRGHSGTDFKAEVGTPVRSTFDGRITRTSWNVRANGYCIEIDHPGQGIKTRYLHLSRVLVKRGQYIKQGEVIARSGNTGRTFAPHLHYEVLNRGKKKTIYNPFDFKYHKTYHREISSQETSDYQRVVRLYDSTLQQSETGGKTRAG